MCPESIGESIVAFQPDGRAPRVSIVIANFNGGRFLDAALTSARDQTLRDIEIIVVDDASTDDSVAIARTHAAADRRLRVLENATNGGPAVSRNRALAQARGDWIAVFDSDDLMHPARLERLIAVAAADSADIVADNMLIFDDRAAVPPIALLPAGPAAWIDLAAYIRSNALYQRGPALGYLKPLIRSAFLRDHGGHYNADMRIAEDYDLIARLLAHGARFRVTADMTYFYRKHGTSISHRLARRTIAPMLRADDAFRLDFAPLPSSVVSALDHRRRSLETALAFADVVDAIKQRRWMAAINATCAMPRVVGLLRLPVLARLRRVLPHGTRPVHRPPGIVVLSRQRVVGATNGSSAYLLSLCESLVRAGMEVHFVGPSPAVFGRWPVLALRPEMRAFASIRIRGGLRVGRFIFARDYRVMGQAVLTAFDRLAGRLGLGSGQNVKQAPYAIATPWTQADFLFVARHTHPRGDAVIADYAFLTDGFAYTLRPEIQRCVIMHDLFSSRQAQFSSANAHDSVASIAIAAEMALLGQADAIIAIQHDEAGIVRRHLPDRQVIVAPMATVPVSAAQPGRDDHILFVASNTMPNIVGLRWFLDAVWPRIRARAPAALLQVAGGIRSAFADAPEGVTFLGRVDDLTALYRDAGVVISPLLQGSGLKIKLIEAMGQGKAIVATPITVQGVDTLVTGVLPVTDDAAVFAAETLALMADRGLRLVRGEAALAVARTTFSADSCYRDFVGFLSDATTVSASTRCAASSVSEMKSVLGTAANAA
jgi:succinoglycan biosynthesis protein ExoO